MKRWQLLWAATAASTLNFIVGIHLTRDWEWHEFRAELAPILVLISQAILTVVIVVLVKGDRRERS
jgi:alcohol dehydrogenase YqhD (iron-dependent ADH family)